MSVAIFDADSLTDEEPPPVPRSRKHPVIARIWRFVQPLVQAAIVSFFVVVITFFLSRLFLGDPARRMLGINASQAEVDALRAEWGLDRPLVVQFGDYMLGLLQGDMGMSIMGSGVSVSTLIFGTLGNTVALALLSLTFAVILGIITGLWAAVTRVRAVDVSLRFLAMLGLAAPPALVGLLLIFGLAVQARLAPVGGWGSGYPENFRYLLLPVLTVTILATPLFLRVVRERAVTVLSEPHIEASRARGIPPVRLLIRHVLPNCAVPVVTVAGLSAGSLLSGAVIAEAVFGMPGLGLVLLNAMKSSDFPVIQGAAIISGAAVALCNALAEIAQRAIDPRTR